MIFDPEARTIAPPRRHSSAQICKIKNAPDHHWRGRFLFSCQALEEAKRHRQIDDAT